MKINKVTLSLLAVCIGYSGFADSANYVSSDSVYDGDTYTNHEVSGDETTSYDDTTDDTTDRYDTGDDTSDDMTGGYGYDDDTADDTTGGYGTGDDVDKQRLALNLVGTGEMYEMAVPDIDGDGQPDSAFCFDVDLKNAANGKIIGTATDCLSNIEPGENGGVKLVGTTFFNLPNGQIVTRGLTTVQPVNQPTVTPDGEAITHITGASSDENGVIQTSGDFAWYHGTARLSGMVNLEQFGGGVDDPLFFDCLFIIDLVKQNFKYKDWKGWHGYHYYGEHYRKHHHHKKHDHDKMNESSDYSGEHEKYDDKHVGYR